MIINGIYYYLGDVRILERQVTQGPDRQKTSWDLH